MFGKHIDHRVFQRANHGPYAQPTAANIQQGIGDQLPGPMVGHLTTTIRLYNRDVACHQHMLGTPGLPLSKDRGMLDQPKLIGNPGITFIGEASHGLPDRYIVTLSQAIKRYRSRS
ncbi:hypothetical protein BH688_03370 [Kushneria phosphatilytica]|nr:hypothetical protein BH688_03370 [Kushneria phosphatilytica]